jgi:hypothetical protein
MKASERVARLSTNVESLMSRWGTCCLQRLRNSHPSMVLPKGAAQPGEMAMTRLAQDLAGGCFR